MESLAEFVVAARFESLADDVVAFASQHLADSIGVMVAGSRSEGISELRRQAQGWGGNPESAFFLEGSRTSAQYAALVNGAMARALDYDDVNELSLGHPTVSVMPTALAVAEMLGGVSGRDLLTAIVVGAEITVRLGLAPEIGSQVSGMSHTYQPAVFGATAAAAKLLGYSVGQTVDSLGHAYGFVSGSQEGVVEASLAVRMQQGFTAMVSVIAARLGGDMKSIRRTFEGPYGYFNVYHQGRYDRDIVVNDLGARYHYLQTSMKPYPSGRATHAALEAGRQLAEMTRVRFDDIDSFEVEVSSIAARLTAPAGRAGRFHTTLERMFSQSWNFALGYVRGIAELADFGDDPPDVGRLTDVARLVKVIAADGGDGTLARHVGGARARLLKKNGQKFEVEVEFPKGSPERPISAAESQRKFLGCCSWADMTETDARELMADLYRVHLLDNTNQITGRLARPQGAIGEGLPPP